MGGGGKVGSRVGHLEEVFHLQRPFFFTGLKNETKPKSFVNILVAKISMRAYKK